jgi:hypothetical protein
MTASQSPEGPRISRRRLLHGAGTLGLSVASGAWLKPGRAFAATATSPHRIAQSPLLSADHLVAPITRSATAAG